MTGGRDKRPLVFWRRDKRPLVFWIIRMRLPALSLAFCLAVPLFAAAPKPAPKPAAKPVVKRAAKTPVKTTARKGKAPRVPAQTWRNRQVAPSKDRYSEIQQALYEQGYLPSEPSGVWNQESIQALRQFQADQKLSITGRISALTLINLGLGPNHPPLQVPIPSAQN